MGCSGNDGSLPDCRQTRRYKRRMAALLGPGGARSWRGLRETGTKESGRATKARREGKPGTWLTGPPCPGNHHAASCGLPRFSLPPRQACPGPSSQAPVSRSPRQTGKFRVSQGIQPDCQGSVRATSDEYRATSQPAGNPARAPPGALGLGAGAESGFLLRRGFGLSTGRWVVNHRSRVKGDEFLEG